MNVVGRFYLADVLGKTLEHCAGDDGIAMECAEAIMERMESDGCQILRGAPHGDLNPDEVARIRNILLNVWSAALDAMAMQDESTFAELSADKREQAYVRKQEHHIGKAVDALRGLVAGDAARKVLEGLET